MSERTIKLYADESRAQQAVRLTRLTNDPSTIYFAHDEHGRSDLPTRWPLAADVWIWQSGNRWVATIAGFHDDDWWEGSDDEDWDNAPHRWYRPIEDVPTTGTLSYLRANGEQVEEPASGGETDLAPKIGV